MSRTLTWQYLSPLHVTRIQSAASDVSAVRSILLEADAESRAGYFSDLTDERQIRVLVDYFFHLLRFARQQSMTAEKQSTLVSIAYHTHKESMSKRLTVHDSFAAVQRLLIEHSVHRPPYSAAVFAVDDAKQVVDYVLGTYYRHYKLYLYAFSRRSVAHVEAVSLGDLNETLPVIPPLTRSTPLVQWEAVQAEARRKELERLKKLEDEETARLREEQRRKAADAAGPPMPAGLKAQLESIRSKIGQQTGERIDELEARLAGIEAKLLAHEAKPSSQLGPKPGAAGAPAAAARAGQPPVAPKK